MPSLLHEELLLLLRREPLFALTALQRPGGLELPPFTSIAVVPGEIRQLLPTERRADIVVLMRDDEPVFAIVIEVQTSIDHDKRWTWPLYLAALRAEHRCPVALVVFAIDPAIRRWSATPISTGHPGHDLVPLVVGPVDIPRVTDEQEARENPYRAILSALVHALEPGAEHLVLAAFQGADTLTKADADTWRELLVEAIKNNDVARRAVEALMDIPNFRDRSGWYKEGREQATHDAIARVLARRGLALEPSQQRRLTECRDMATLDRWLDEAVSAASAEDALRLEAYASGSRFVTRSGARTIAMAPPADAVNTSDVVRKAPRRSPTQAFYPYVASLAFGVLSGPARPRPVAFRVK